mmetsp:Transcript_47867/g.95581  ORF Transcript_47867/g.95581 Transcript_47867/m.95581 type:complete len:256 (+) Transcript_47867:349-1116(+)
MATCTLRHVAGPHKTPQGLGKRLSTISNFAANGTSTRQPPKHASLHAILEEGLQLLELSSNRVVKVLVTDLDGVARDKPRVHLGRELHVRLAGRQELLKLRGEGLQVRRRQRLSARDERLHLALGSGDEVGVHVDDLEHIAHPPALGKRGHCILCGVAGLRRGEQGDDALRLRLARDRGINHKVVQHRAGAQCLLQEGQVVCNLEQGALLCSRSVYSIRVAARRAEHGDRCDLWHRRAQEPSRARDGRRAGPRPH